MDASGSTARPRQAGHDEDHSSRRTPSTAGTIRQPDELGRLVLQGELTIRTIEATHAELRELIERHAVVELDAAGATLVDVSFIQLALAARRSAEAAGKRIVWAAPAGGVLRDALARGGFLGSLAGRGAAAETWWSATARVS